MTALIVEGDVLVRRILADTLRSCDPQMEVVEDGDVAAGRRDADLKPPALAIVNLDLPESCPLIEHIKQVAPSSTIAVWLDGDSLTDRETAEGAGATHFLDKTETGIEEITRLAEEAIRGQEQSA